MNRWLDLVASPVLWIGKASGEPVAKPAYGRFSLFIQGEDIHKFLHPCPSGDGVDLFIPRLSRGSGEGYWEVYPNAYLNISFCGLGLLEGYDVI
jgi:hypothetical protein